MTVKTTTADRTPGTKVIHAGLFRTATMSMATAYRRLGYTVQHGLDDVSISGNPWTLIEDAAHSTWPELLGPLPTSSPIKTRPRPIPYRRQDWDRLWGDKYDVATDLASPFAEAMIAAYPEAKVVVVQRDFDKWWASFKTECIDTAFAEWPPAWFVNTVAWNIMGTRAGHGAQALFSGLLGTRNAAAMTKDQARVVYEAYYSRIRALVPAERRLEYKVGDGWGPLCEFLGKEIPHDSNGEEEPFPWVNDAAQHQEFIRLQIAEVNKAFTKTAMPWVAGAGVIVGGWVLARFLL